MLRAADLADLDAAFLGDNRCVDHVDLREVRFQQAGENRLCQCAGVEFRDVAFEDDLDGLDAGLGQLACKRTELFSQRNPGLHDDGLVGRDRGHVDRVRDRARQQVVRHLLGDLQGDVFLRFRG